MLLRGPKPAVRRPLSTSNDADGAYSTKDIPMRRRSLFTTGIAAAVIAATGCGGHGFINTANLPDNHCCQYMKEVCREAREFENAYTKLPRKERKDAENILKAYRIQCNDALEECKKSAKAK
jgi:hypothetical protein